MFVGQENQQMKKIVKLALEEEQIAVKSLYKRFDGYEIHTYGDERDHFELAATLNKPIFTVHYPIKESDVYDVCNSFDSEHSHKIYDLCERCHAGLVIHAETTLSHLMENPNLNAFIDYMKKRSFIIHVENCYRNCGAIEGLKVCHYLQSQLGNDRVFPLLDTCHLMMSEMSFKFEEMSFFQTLEAYGSRNFKIHLSDCIGSGEIETGGTHGTNFYANQYLLSNILWKLRDMEIKNGIVPDLILEVDEVDYVYPTNADMLAKNIDKLWPGICQDYEAWNRNTEDK